MTRVNKVIMVLCLILTTNQLWATCSATIALTKPNVIYTDNGDGTVLDKQTGLIWQKCSLGQICATGNCTGTAALYDWKAALEAAQTANILSAYGHNDWRLPCVS